MTIDLYNMNMPFDVSTESAHTPPFIKYLEVFEVAAVTSQNTSLAV